MIRRPPRSTLFPSRRSSDLTVNMPHEATVEDIADAYLQAWRLGIKALAIYRDGSKTAQALRTESQDAKGTVADVKADRKSTRLNSSHANISYAVFCLKKKKS